jgi:A/G-specific adenine glycosylase
MAKQSLPPPPERSRRAGSKSAAAGEPPGSAQATPHARELLAWFAKARRDLPWRARPGEHPDPYRVWLSEIMLQQTTIAAVDGYFRRFVARWPDVDALARASLDEVLHAWQGLGYYARARNLHRCAKIVSETMGGEVPSDEESLRALPGIGPYTAAAIAAIAFDRKATALDGNVERVMARLHAVETELPKAKPELRRHAQALTPARNAGDYIQAVMELGQTICTPKSPSCLLCPWRNRCAAHARGIAAILPRRAAKPERPLRRATVYWAVREDGAVLLQRRPENGLLGGMMEFPSTPPCPARWKTLPGTVEHGFTHFRLVIEIRAARVAGRDEGTWCAPEKFDTLALPTVMKKVARHALAAAERKA